MKKYLLSVLVLLMAANTVFAVDYQLPDPSFEDWSGATFDGNVQNKYWHASNVEQSALGMTFRFNFAHRETGHTGSYCMMVQDQTVGAAGITETGPGYFSLGYGWQYLEGLNTGSATAGTKGGISFTARPDTVSVWIKRTGNNTDKEDFHILYYAWTTTAKGTSYKNKNEGCTSTTVEDEESDIRIALDGNECKTTTAGGQVSEGWWREKKSYGSWTNIRVPVFYMNDNAPKKCNLIFSASNYPAFRANSGLYEGNSLYVDDVELIYSSKIHKLEVGEKEWKGFDPNSTAVQVYSLGETATAVPDIVAYRGNGSLTNIKNKTVAFPGRKLSGSEITIVKGDLVSVPTTITVKSEDGKSTTVYKIQFQKAASSNAKLAGITVNGEALSGFSATKYTYPVELPYGTTAAPVVAVEKQEDKQTVAISQATSVNGTAIITVTAADGKTTQKYTLNFSVGQLADNTLQDITVNGKSVPGFTPSQANYKVSLPVGTNTVPTIVGVSKYPAGAQTITYTLPTAANLDGGQALIQVTTPGNQTPKTYKLTFKLEASSYSYLKSIKVGGVEVTGFEPTNLTYRIKLPLGTTSLPAITWEQGDEYQTVAIEEGGIDGTTRITVTAGNGDKSVYKLVFNTEKSDRSTLNNIYVGGVALEGFSPDLTTYTYKLPIGTTTLPEITYDQGDEWQTVNVTPGNVNGTTRITVTAGDGSTTIYLITFSVDAFTDNTLKSLSVDGYSLQNANGDDVEFDSEVNEYWVNLAKGTTARPEVSYEAKEAAPLQTLTVRDGGVSGDYKITVRPQSGTSRTYIIHFSVATSNNTKLTMIYLGGKALDGFDADTLEYTYRLPEGESTIPAITFDKAEAKQRVLSVLEDTTQVITVTAENGTATRTYKIHFVITLSANAFLDMIYLDGDSLVGFEPEKLNYTVEMSGATCPKITVDKAAGQQVSIASPVAAGTAVILVKPEQGAAMKYTIKLETVAATTVRLTNILVDGVALAGFAPEQLHYTGLTYDQSHPAITVEKAEGQEVKIMWIDDVVYLHVNDTLGNVAVYDIEFNRHVSNNTALASIKADDVEIDGWDAAKKQYNFVLASGSAYPTLSYVKGDAAQAVTFGQVGEGKWNFVVTAENGDTTAYSVQYSIAKSSDAQLINLQPVGILGFSFDPATYTYSGFNLDEGAQMPDLQITAKEGQQVLSVNVNDHEQKVLVMAENGDTISYTITYTRVQSNNALLANIKIGGRDLYEFRADSMDYTYQLAEGTTVVPNVFPIGQNANQIITTEYSSPDGVTRIHVEAQDGTMAHYTIAFPVAKSANTKLKRLTVNGVDVDVNKSNHEFNLPFGSNFVNDVTYKKENKQTVDFTLAPITGVTTLVVKAENGDTREYTIRFNIAQPQGTNKIEEVFYTYNNTQHGSIVPKVGDNEITLPATATSFRVDSVRKSYPEQTVLFYDGGIRRGATIIASANRDNVADVTYRIIPVLQADTTGKLKDLKFKGVTVPRFRPDVYNYMVNVTEEPTKANFVGTAYESGKSVTNSDIDSKNKKITVKVAGGKTYTISWFYNEDEWPFTFERVQTEKTYWYEVSSTLGGAFGAEADKKSLVDPTGYKPKGWTVPADLFAYVDYNATISHFSYYTGHEVTVLGEKEVMLSTLRGGALNSSMPGTMTLGGLSLPSKVRTKGGTKVSFEKDLTNAVQYRNTPEQFQLEYQPIMTVNGINTWSAWVAIGNSSGTVLAQQDITGSYDNMGTWQTKTANLSYSGTVDKLNIMLCASEVSGNSYSIYDGSTAKSCDLQIRNMRFVYNSALTAGKVGNSNLTFDASNKKFTYNVPSAQTIIGLPALTFTGAVEDQTRTIEWLNNGEWVNGVLTARVVNYGENANTATPDSTVYTVEIKRAAETSLDYDAEYGTFDEEISGDTIIVKMPFGRKNLPDFKINPNSTNQRFEISKSLNDITVKVMAENNTSKTTVYSFRETKTSDAVLNDLVATDAKGDDVELFPDFEATTYNYTVTAAQMPLFEFERTSSSVGTEMGETVSLSYTATGAEILVTAADGVTTNTYTINWEKPAIVSTGLLGEFKDGTTEINDLGGTTFTCNLARPSGIVFFERQTESDSVVFVQTPNSMEWQVYGGSNNTYTWTYATQADNALLNDLLVNESTIEGFAPTISDYDVEVEGRALVQAIPAEEGQTIASEIAFNDEGGVDYTITVTAADGVAKKAYKVRVDRPKSDVSSLAGIMVDGQMLANFNSDVLDYTVTLPTPAVKTAESQMPSIDYIAGQSGQRIDLTQGTIGNGEPTTILVKAENGDSREYSVTVLAEPSHCAELTGIMVNGEALEGFEPGRHYYSMELTTNVINVEYAADDRFQTVDIEENGHNRTVVVTAQDGTTQSRYYITIFVQSQSNDATLSNILLNDAPMADFQRALQPKLLTFDPGNNTYDIVLPAGTSDNDLPEVSAQLKMDGQTVEIERVGMKVNLKVKAVDLSENTYTLNFTVPQSKNANLGMIYLNGDSIANFAPDYYFYEVNLPVGTHSLPAVDVQKQETKQTVVQDDPDLDKLQVVIHVAAEDTAYKSTYTVLFHYTRSDADTLQMVYVDGDSLKTFRPNVFFYNDSLAVGTTAFPDLSWEEADEWQTIKIDTMLHNANQMVRQISVVSESLKKNTYSFTYTICKSSVDTLQMIYVDTKPLEGFHATENEYTLNLSAAYANELNGALPAIDYLEADTTQTVLISQAPDSLSGKSLGYKSLISVTAESGAMRIYTLHYNVEQSSDATLGMIFLGGKPLNGFDAQKQTYRLDLDSRSSLPAVTVMKNEAAQTYDISIHGDSILIDVYAEDATQMTYTLVFNRQLSDNAQLQSIRVEGHPEFLYSFVSSEYDYRLKLAYGEDSIPAITYVLNDSLQTVVEPYKMDTLENGDIRVTITVIAPNGEDEAEYTIIFRFTKNNDALLKSISLGETLLENFNSYQYDYVFKHPFGSDSTDFYTADSIRYILSDTLATATVVGSADGTIMITVVAQDEETESTYTIRQIIGLDNDAALEALLLDSVLIKGFDPEITFYTYLLKDGDVPPMITAIPRSENAEEPSIGTAAAGDTCRIICTAADGTERRYYIHFAISSVDAGLIPTANDLLLKRVPGSLSLFAASIRQGVSFVLYDQYGHVVYMAEQLPMANPNDVEVASDPNRSESEQIADVVVSEENGIIIPINPGDIYLYGFYMKEGTKTILIKSGKIVADFLPAGGVSL